MRLSLLSLLIMTLAFPAQASVEKIEDYLSNLKTMTADFKQKDPAGTISTGKFQLKRPKKMRWQYNPPTPILMITRGNFLTYYDYDLDQVSDIPLDDTLLSILSRQEVDFKNSDLAVAEHYEEGGYETITLEEKDAPENGSLSLVFKQSPMQLVHLAVTDATQGTTQISLSNIARDMKLSDKIFEFKDPRVGGKNKKSDRFGSDTTP